MGEGVCVENLKIMIYITGISILLVVLIQSLHRKIPTVSIEELYVDFKTSNYTPSSIYFDLKLDNKNPVGVYYRPMNLTFSYVFPNKTSSNTNTLGVYTLPAFHQHHHKQNHIRHTLILMLQPQPQPQPQTVVVVMRVDLFGRVKFKSIAQWKRTMVMGVDVEVDCHTGQKLNKTPIQLLPSPAPPMAVININFMLIIIGLFINFMFL